MYSKKIKHLITSLLVFITLASCSLIQLNTSKTASIRISFGSSSRAVDIGTLIDSNTAFLKIDLHGDVEVSQTVLFTKNVSVLFENIPVGSNIYIDAQIFIREGNKIIPQYQGRSEKTKIKSGENNIPVILRSYVEDGTSHPATGEIEIFIESEEDIYQTGSQIIVTAFDKKGNSIAADKITVEFHIKYLLYGELHDFIVPSKVEDADGVYTYAIENNKIIIVTQLTDNLPPDPIWYFRITASDGTDTQTKTFEEFEILSGSKTETQFSMTYTDEELYERESLINFSAKDKNGNKIKAENLDIKLFKQILGSNNPSDMTENCNIEKDTYNIILTTAIPITSNSDNLPVPQYEYYFILTNTINSETKKFIVSLIPTRRPEHTFVMQPSDGKLVAGQPLFISAFDKDSNPVNSENITCSGIYYNFIDKGQTIKIDVPNTAYRYENGIITLEELNVFEIGTNYCITFSISRGELEPDSKTFNFTIVPMEVTQTIDISQSETQITEAINSTIQNVKNNPLVNVEFKFTGNKDSTSLNIYKKAVEIICDNENGISKVSENYKLKLDYSAASGSSLSEIPEETFKGLSILKSIIISDSTLKIGDSAFANDDDANCVELDNLDLKNVTEIGMQCFAGTKVQGTFNLPRVTKFGSWACSGMNDYGNYPPDYPFELILGAAEEIYKTEEGYGEWVFAYSYFKTISADKLKRIADGAFMQIKTNHFAIDSLVYVGSNSFSSGYTPHNVYFDNDENYNNWYGIAGGFDVNGDNTEESAEDLAIGLYNKTYNITDLYNSPYNTNGEIIKVEDGSIINKISAENNATNYVRVVE